MSNGYASRLSPKDDLGGQLGAPEKFDSEEEINRKVMELADLVRQAKRIVFFTGAGISTACGIPDFRGPNGVWTLKQQGKKLPENTTPFYAARPSFTHMAIVALYTQQKVSYVVSQNVDCLHFRSGIPRQYLAELHGNCFAERCPKCNFEYIRTFEQETVGFKLTGRSCEQKGCTGRLRDNILDWDDALPEEEYGASLGHARNADLMIVLGSSLQVTPANDIPVETVKNGGKLVIVNLQETPKDKHAHMIIRGKSDDIMKKLIIQLNCVVPIYRRQELISVKLQQSKPQLDTDGVEMTDVKLTFCGLDGPNQPIPMIQKLSASFPEVDNQVFTEIRGQKGCKPLVVHLTTRPGQLDVVMDIQFVEHVDHDKRQSKTPFELSLFNLQEFNQEVKDCNQKLFETDMQLGYVVQCQAFLSKEEASMALKKRKQSPVLEGEAMQPSSAKCQKIKIEETLEKTLET
eukprot:TRINITY_DN14989_c0_g1_i5.p1 TRINITY_DN14989_c0_g1~~TRINITY_DN14989_c0_g1_i5.p1  ORF type:complete len:461 (+),score=68.86 TRINITY_DN14989_c0_g1_i5:89-1471(+)